MFKRTKHKWCARSYFHRIKKNKGYKIVRFRQSFEKRFITSSSEFPLLLFFFLVSLFTCFGHFIGVFHYSIGQSMDSNEELFLTQNYLSQEVLEPNFSMGCMYRKWSRVWSKNSLYKNLKKISSREKIKKGQTEPRKTSEGRTMIAIREF